MRRNPVTHVPSPLISFSSFQVIQADISSLSVDAIVNPINSQGLGCFLPNHRCVDNIIHRRAGPRLRALCKWHLGGKTVKTGEAFGTRGCALPAS